MKKLTLKEIVKKLGDHIEEKNEFVAFVTTQKSFLERAIYWEASDYKVTGIYGSVIGFRKN